MRYQPTMYAQAFWDVMSVATGTDQKRMIGNFVNLIAKNGDFPRSSAIIEEIEKLYVKDKGGRMVKLEFARKQPDSLIKQLKDNFTKDDLVQTAINSSLVAGVRETIDGERELDKTMRRKLTRLFKT